MLYEAHKQRIIDNFKEIKKNDVKAKVLYNFGYIPEDIKQLIIQKVGYKDEKKLEFYV